METKHGTGQSTHSHGASSPLLTRCRLSPRSVPPPLPFFLFQRPIVTTCSYYALSIDPTSLLVINSHLVTLDTKGYLSSIERTTPDKVLKR